MGKKIGHYFEEPVVYPKEHFLHEPVQDSGPELPIGCTVMDSFQFTDHVSFPVGLARAYVCVFKMDGSFPTVQKKGISVDLQYK